MGDEIKEKINAKFIQTIFGVKEGMPSPKTSSKLTANDKYLDCDFKQEAYYYFLNLGLTESNIFEDFQNKIDEAFKKGNKYSTTLTLDEDPREIVACSLFGKAIIFAEPAANMLDDIVKAKKEARKYRDKQRIRAWKAVKCKKLKFEKKDLEPSNKKWNPHTKPEKTSVTSQR